MQAVNPSQAVKKRGGWFVPAIVFACVGIAMLGVRFYNDYSKIQTDRRVISETPVRLEYPVKFKVSVTPQGSDPRLVDVWVDASDPTFWPRMKPRLQDRSARWMVILKPASTPVHVDGYGMDGHQSVVGERLCFRPSLPLVVGETYRVSFSPWEFLGPQWVPIEPWVEYTIPTLADTPASVTSIYPSGDELPANHLKFYVFFSTPMEQGSIWDHFELIDDTTGKPVPDPFRPTELWSEDGQRLTLWFHPGRQKTGVNLNVDIGPILEAGHRYTLVISKGWRAQDGGLLKDDVRKSFLATEAEHAQVDPHAWTIIPPVVGTDMSLNVKFPKPLDWSLLHRELHVEDALGKQVEGYVGTDAGERLWEFTPDSVWKAGQYELVVGGVLEDLAGNSVARPFEVDITQKPKGPPIKSVRLKFEVPPAK